jgi:hypothetical protein
MRRIFKNKKGVLSGILDSVGQLIQGILTIVPKPLLILIFLFLIVTVSYILSIIFNSFGIYCNSANEPVQLNTNILTSISLISQIPDPKQLGLEQLNMEESGITIISEQITECSTQVQEGYYILSNNQRINFNTPTYFYDGTYCTECNAITLYDNVTGRVGGVSKKWCVGKVARNEDKSLLQKALCGNLACEPPQHYQYDPTPNAYTCSDQTCAGITLGQKWDELLASKNAQLMYQTQDNQRQTSADQLLGITCQDLKPRLAIWGIDLFRYEYIFVLLIIWILIWIYMNVA